MVDKSNQSKRFIFFIIIFCSILPHVLSELTPDDKAYLEMLSQKSDAQMASKVDSQVTRIEAEINTNLETAKTQLRQMLIEDIKQSLKSLVVGLAGMVIVSLGLFKIIDLKLNHTRNIQKYEKELQSKTAKLDETIKQNMDFRLKLQQYKANLVQREQLINKYVIQGMNLPPIQQPILQVPVPKPKRKILFTILLIIILVALLGVGGYFTYKFIRGGL